MRYTVTFENVGRDKRNWTQDFDVRSEGELLKSIHKNGGLISRSIDIEIDGTHGVILVGGFRPVGEFTIRDNVI